MATTAQRLNHQVVTQPPPTRGLNTIDAMASMAATDAVEMDNFLSDERGVQLREGWRDYATGLGDAVRTVFSYEGSPGSAVVSPLTRSQLFAATDGGIYDVEGGGPIVAGDRLMGLSGNSYAGRFSFIQITNDTGQYLVACSEVDGGFIFNGVTWMKMTSTGGPGVGIVTGVDPSLFVQVCAFKKRLMFVERNSARAWILDPGAVGGAAKKFDFGPLLRSGGMVLALVNWTADAGEGIDDRLVILGSSGDLVVYEGTDPTDAANFQNVGTWYVGQPPVGRRCFTTAGGNIYVLTSFGVIPVQQVVTGGLETLQLSGTEYVQQLRKINGVLNEDFATLSNRIGWEIMYLPAKALLYVARPQAVSNEFVQYAFQEHNMAWSRLLDIPAVTFGRRLNQVYAGTADGRVLRVLDGHSDGMALDGTAAHEIRGRLTPAFGYFGDPGVVKQALMTRVNFLGNVEPSYVVTMNTNFAVQGTGLAPTPGKFIGSLWNQARWDEGVWVGSRGAFGEWRSVEGMGYSLAPTIYAASEQIVNVANIEHMVKMGGPL